ncbi:hypothetical protein CRG98_043241, partial [Punica granatum]
QNPSPENPKPLPKTRNPFRSRLTRASKRPSQARRSPGSTRRRLPRLPAPSPRRSEEGTAAHGRWIPLLRSTSSSPISPSLTGSAHLFGLCRFSPVELAQPSPTEAIRPSLSNSFRLAWNLARNAWVQPVRPNPSEAQSPPQPSASCGPALPVAQLPRPRPSSHARGPVLRDPARPSHARPNSPAQRPFQPVRTVQTVCRARIPRIRYTPGPTPSLVNHGVQCPHTPSARNPSAEPGLVSTYCFAPSSVYVEDDSDRVYPVPLDLGNLPALDLRVVKLQVATPSHVRPSRILGKVDTPKSRCIGARMRVPTRRNSGAHSLATPLGTLRGRLARPLVCASTKSVHTRESHRVSANQDRGTCQDIPHFRHSHHSRPHQQHDRSPSPALDQNKSLRWTLRQFQGRPISSIGLVRLACPRGTRLLEPSLGRLRLPTHTQERTLMRTPAAGHAGHGQRVMRGFTPPREHYRAFHPFTSIGKGSDHEVPPYEAEDEDNQANHLASMRPSSLNIRQLQQRTPSKRHALDYVWCDVVMMDVCHLLLGRPWQFDRSVSHDGRTNKYNFTHKGIKIVPVPNRDRAAFEPEPADPVTATNLLSFARFQEELDDAEFMFALVGREVVEEGLTSYLQRRPRATPGRLARSSLCPSTRETICGVEEQPFELHSDASKVGIEAVLSQNNRPIVFFSEKLTGAKVRYNTYDVEFYAVMQAVKHWRHYLFHKEFVLYTDHEALKHLHSQDKDGFLFRGNQLCIPDCSLRAHIIQQLHGEGHVGRDRTLQLVQSSYFWPTICKEVEKYVQRCKPWVDISMDFVLGLPCTQRGLVGEHVKSWDQKLSQVEFAHNHAVNRSTGFSPLQVVYSVTPRGPLDMLPVPDKTRVNGKAADFVHGLQEIHEAVQNNLHNVAMKYKAVADRRRRHVEFEVGNFVWVVLTKDRFSASDYHKLAARKIGPVEVIEKINSNAYRLKLPSHIRTVDVFNVKHLVPYIGDSSDDDDSRSNSLHPGENDAVENLASRYLEKNRF